MQADFLHNHKEFSTLLDIIEDETGIQASLVEKDYWIMHVLHGLNQLGLQFELKGGTSLSKGYKIIHRFSEDIDIHIKPPPEMEINENPNNTNENNFKKRKEFYDWLSSEKIKIPGIVSVERDEEFDDVPNYRSGGIRLRYNNKKEQVAGLKAGILLEAGFDNVTPNSEITISSWAHDKAVGKSIEIIDNRAIGIRCYHPGYTLVEKLQTIATKFRREREGDTTKPNFMRQYYDVYCLLENKEVQEFIGSKEYHQHKDKRFPKADLKVPANENEAFRLRDPEIKKDFQKRYEATKALYYSGQPDFQSLIERIEKNLDRL